MVFWPVKAHIVIGNDFNHEDGYYYIVTFFNSLFIVVFIFFYVFLNFFACRSAAFGIPSDSFSS